jgi:hypothetical protein
VARILVNAAHELELLASLVCVLLDITFLICTETPWSFQKPRLFQSKVKAVGKAQLSTIADDRMDAIRVTLYVLQRLIHFRIMEIEEFKPPFHWIVDLASQIQSASE